MYIPENINYYEIKGISNIARAGLEEVRPLSIGEATRISGVTSNDITLIIAHMNVKQKYKINKKFIKNFFKNKILEKFFFLFLIKIKIKYKNI